MNMATKTEQLAAATLNDPRWSAVVARDPAAEGTFFYSVKTTGIYCRPSCPSRPARPENIQFHLTAAHAEQAGFRPCKRCQPNQPQMAEQQTTLITQLCRFIEKAEQTPNLHELAEHAGLSTYHLHRIFKTVTGVTPKAYAAAHRASRIHVGLKRSHTVTEAIYDAGYNSNGHFYEKSNQILGMTPTNYRSGGSNTEIRFAIGQCSLGAILVAASKRGVCTILLGDEPNGLIYDLQDRFPHAILVGSDAKFEQWVAKVVGFVEAPRIGLDLPLDVRGTAFQQRVWQALQEIPAGETVSYTDVAQRIGAPKAVRAVARACAANALAVAIPCHRVVRIDGGLSGYRWGIERKRALLAREAQTYPREKIQ